jgi:quercetin dioxygenase-like cupin family protein
MPKVVSSSPGPRLDLFGPSVEFLTSPKDANQNFCVLRGFIPPGLAVPLHSHPDVEDFYIVSGEVRGVRQGANGYEWFSAKAGDFVHVPGGEPHGWQNPSTSEPLVTLIVTTPKLGRFFLEVGRTHTGKPQAVAPDDLARFMAASKEYGYWNATPAENAALRLRL